jgi:hypothetical protein
MEASFSKGGDMKLEPWYVTGLCEGEASFSVSFNWRRKLNVGIETRPSFSVTLNARDLELIKALRSYFRCGAIRFSRSDNTYKFEVRSIADLNQKIIPHFRRYPLSGSKARDFQAFARICEMVKANLHLNKKHLREIIELAYQMNPSGKRRLMKEELLRELGEVKV